MSGRTTETAKVEKIFKNGTVAEFPMNINKSIGVTTMPKKDPKADLKIAAASLPPTALVRMTADETGGGMQETTVRPDISQGSRFVKRNRRPVKNQTAHGTKAIVKV